MQNNFKKGDTVRVVNPRNKKFLYSGKIIEIFDNSAKVCPKDQNERNAGVWRFDWLNK